MADETPSRDPSTRWLETSRGILRYQELAPLLAERVLRVQERIEAGAFASHVLDEDLIRSLHREFCGDLVPDWAGNWRTVDVRVGRHEPPAPHLVPQQMRDYTRDLQARWDCPLEQLPESLAFAEGRLLSIHPSVCGLQRTSDKAMALGVAPPPSITAGGVNLLGAIRSPQLFRNAPPRRPTGLSPAG